MFTIRTKLALAKGIITKKVPIYVQYAVTKKCNLGCKMCGSSVSRKEENELTLAEIKKLADVLDRLNISIIILTGGEPFMRQDIVEIIRIFAKKGFTVRLQTNGILPDEKMIRSAYQAGMREVTISLDSLIPEKQDAITGQKGSWFKIVESIARFSRILPSFNNLLGINTVVCKQNLEEVPDIIRFVTACGFYSSLIPIHLDPVKNDFIIRKSASEFSFTPEDHEKIEQIYERVICMKNNGYNIYNSYKFLRNSPDFLKGKKIDWHCDSPYLYFSISPSGKFLPCVDINTSIPMLNDDFPDLYNSEGFKFQIKEMVKKCPGCFYACYPEISYFCRDFRTTLERFWLGCKISCSIRRPISYNDSLKLIEKIRYAKEDNR